jgi:hypothetical protein
VGWLTDLFSKRSLDDRLLTGELSTDSGQGKVRAEQLLSARHRARSAKALRELVEEAQRPQASFFNANLRVQRLVIRENQALILTLARELEELAAVNPRGVIHADRLVTDGESPAYNTGSLIEDHGRLASEVERARAALKAD